MHIKPKLVVLSDLWGHLSPHFNLEHLDLLCDKFEVQLFDSRQLAEINLDLKDENEIHQQFVESGIDKAVSNLSKIVPENTFALGFSIGGTILWKAAVKGLKFGKLIAVSSTRLRLETKLPNTDIHLIYGELDKYVPTQRWFDSMSISPIFIKNKGHELYKEKEYIQLINQILLEE